LPLDFQQVGQCVIATALNEGHAAVSQSIPHVLDQQQLLSSLGSLICFPGESNALGKQTDLIRVEVSADWKVFRAKLNYGLVQHFGDKLLGKVSKFRRMGMTSL
jgi:hypothetical protein